MNFDLTEEQTMICDGAARLMREHGALDRRRERIARGEGYDAEVWGQFAELGLLALCLPEEEGGIGGDITDIAALMIELGRGLSSEPIVSGAILSAGLLAASGWDGRADWIEGAVSGGRRIAFANLEDGERIERAAPRATVLRESGDGFVLSGRKLLVQDGEGADAYLVTASIAGSDDLALVLVPADAAGLTLDAYPLIDGTRAVDLHLADVTVPAANLVARGAIVADILDTAIARATIAVLAAGIGSMEACLDTCADYLKTRQQFGQPIGKFQALQHFMADMLVATHNARSSLYHALSKMGAAGAERTAAIASAKLAVGEAGLFVSRTAIQLHGGYGVTDEYAVSHHYKYQIALEKRFGDVASHTALLADLTLGDPALA